MEHNPYENNNQPEGYRSIWISTIIQALIDAVSVNKEAESVKARKEAIAWINQPEKNSDFATICEMANIEPKVVKDLLEAIQQGRKKPANFRWWRRGKDRVQPTKK